VVVDAQKMETLKNTNRILFVQTAFLGDSILSLPAIEILKEKFPTFNIDVICSPTCKEVFDSSPFVDEVIVLDKKGNHKSIFSLIKFTKSIKRRNYSRIYSLHRSFRTSLLVLLSGVDETFGFSNSAFNYVYKNIVEYRLNEHEVKRNLRLVNYPDLVNDWKIIPKLKITDDVKSKIAALTSEYKEFKKIAIAPGSIWQTKRYPAEKFYRITDRFINEGFVVFLIGSKSDRELCELIKKERNNIVNFAGEFSFVESVELLRNSDLLISNDSAPTHIGVCADIPVITIYCSTIPEFGFYPYNDNSVSISLDEIKCKPCGIHGYKECPLGHFRCANELDENFVIEKALEILAQVGKGNNKI
jgi:heptosyltransferase-2